MGAVASPALCRRAVCNVADDRIVDGIPDRHGHGKDAYNTDRDPGHIAHEIHAELCFKLVWQGACETAQTITGDFHSF